MKYFLPVLIAGALLAACSEDVNTTAETTEASVWTVSDTALFPADRSLVRPEDGVFLSDGRLIVADLRHGLVELNADGTATPFGNFVDTGFVSEAGPDKGGPNGVHLSMDGKYIFTADVFTGRVYRTSVENEETEVIFSHMATVNTAISDSTGAVWFTQSTDGLGEERMFAAVDAPMGDGALYRLARNDDGTYVTEAEMVIEGLDFANGFYLDEQRGALYISETVGNRVLSYDLDVESGRVTGKKVLTEMPTPDNMRMVKDGTLWVASPLSNRVFAIDVDTGESRIVFDAQSERGAELLTEWNRRGEAGESRLDLLGPEMVGEMPGLLTGIIVDSKNQPVFISGLGDALVQLER